MAIPLFISLCKVKDITFLFPNKKVTKEIGIGDTLQKHMHYGMIATGNHYNC